VQIDIALFATNGSKIAILWRHYLAVLTTSGSYLVVSKVHSPFSVVIQYGTPKFQKIPKHFFGFSSITPKPEVLLPRIPNLVSTPLVQMVNIFKTFIFRNTSGTRGSIRAPKLLKTGIYADFCGAWHWSRELQTTKYELCTFGPTWKNILLRHIYFRFRDISGQSMAIFDLWTP